MTVTVAVSMAIGAMACRYGPRMGRSPTAQSRSNGDEVYNWSWLYAVQVGEWGITQHQADVLRDYLSRGGFFMADDFHGAYEWQMFEKRIRMVFPDRPIVEIPNNDPIFH